MYSGRSYGITRWPFRKLKSLERTMRKVQTESEVRTLTVNENVHWDLLVLRRIKLRRHCKSTNDSNTQVINCGGALDVAGTGNGTKGSMGAAAAAGAEIKRRPYTVGNRTVFLSDEELDVDAPPPPPHTHAPVPFPHFPFSFFHPLTPFPLFFLPSPPPLPCSLFLFCFASRT